MYFLSHFFHFRFPFSIRLCACPFNSFSFSFSFFFLLARLFDYPVRIINQKAFLNVSFRNCLSRLINDACWTSSRPPFEGFLITSGRFASSLLNDKFPFILISQNKSQSLMFLLREGGRSFDLQIERKVPSH